MFRRPKDPVKAFPPSFFTGHITAVNEKLEELNGKISDDLKAWILEPYTATDWDWRYSDGCTFARYLPTRVILCLWYSYLVPHCVSHDLHCVRADKMEKKERDAYRREHDTKFFMAMMAFGVPKPVAETRFLFVRLWYKIKY